MKQTHTVTSQVETGPEGFVWPVTGDRSVDNAIGAVGFVLLVILLARKLTRENRRFGRQGR